MAKSTMADGKMADAPPLSANPMNSRAEFFDNIIKSISENTTGPSTTFIQNIQTIYTFPEQECINRISKLPSKILTIFREQMFDYFIDHFTDSDSPTPLAQHGFIIPVDASARSLLKERRNPTFSATDIYSLGKSVIENRIVKKLASGILKNPSSTTSPEPLLNLDSKDSQLLLKKLDEVIRTNEKLLTENLNLKDRLSTIERKLEVVIQHKPTQCPTCSSDPNNTIPIEYVPPPSQSSAVTEPPPPNNISSINNPATTSSNNRTTSSSSSSSNRTSSYSDILRTNIDKGKKDSTGLSQKKVKKTTIVYGVKNSNKTKVAGPTQPYSLFVGGFDLSLTTDDAKSTIQEGTSLNVIGIELNHANKHNQSFRVDISVQDRDKAFEPDRWLKGLIVKPYRFPRNRNNASYDHRSSSPPHNRDYNRYDQWDESIHPNRPRNNGFF